MGCCLGGLAKKSEKVVEGHEAKGNGNSSREETASPPQANYKEPPCVTKNGVLEGRIKGVLKEGDEATGCIQESASWEALSALLGIDIEDPTMLSFLSEVHEGGAVSSPMSVDTSDLLRYCTEKGISKVEDLRTAVTQSGRALLNVRSEGYRAVYIFAFGFIKEPNSRNISLDNAVMYWQLLLSPRWDHCEAWLDFIQQQNRLQITRDEWSVLLDLARLNDISEYDETSFWPVVLDEFIGYLREGEGKKA